MGKCQLVADFGNGKVKISAFRKSGGKYELYGGSIFDTPEGGICEPECLRKFSSALDKLHPAGGDIYILLQTDEKNVFVTEEDYPADSAKSVNAIIESSLSGFVTEETEKFTFSWRLIEKYPSGRGRFQIAAARTDFIEELQDIAEKHKCALKRADIVLNADENLSRLLRKKEKYGLSSNSDTAAIIDVGHKTANVIVFNNENTVAAETLGHNLYRMDKIIADVGGDLKNDPDIALEMLKLNPSYTSLSAQYNGFLEGIASDIIRTVKHAVGSDRDSKLSAVYFTGGLFKTPGLVSAVKESFSVSCYAYPIKDFISINEECINREAKKPYPNAEMFAASLGMLAGGGLFEK